MDTLVGGLDLAMDVAREAGALLRARFDGPRRGVGTKSSSTDMVSDADRASEAMIAERLRAARPADGILGEESGERTGTSGMRWVVDPLDGTTNFLFGIPHWAVSIALEDDQGPVAGVIYDPMRDECFAAARGAGARCNGAPISPSRKADLGDALVATGFSYAPSERAAAARLLPEILPAVRDIRRAGAASLDLAWVACGRVDAYYESPMEWWDVAAGAVIVTEAGGVFDRIPSVASAGTGYLAAGRALAPAFTRLVEAAIAART